MSSRRARPIVAVLLLALAGSELAGCFPAKKPVDEGYEVWNDLISGCLKSGGAVPGGGSPLWSKKPSPLLVNGRTVSLEEMGILAQWGSPIDVRRFSQHVQAGLPGVDPVVSAAFVGVNLSSASISSVVFRASSNVAVLSDAEGQELFGYPGGKWWPEFWRRYPTAQGVLILSRPAVSSGQALVYIGNQTGGLSGLSYLVWLRRSAQGWRAVGGMSMGVS